MIHSDKIIFLNQPKISPHEADGELNVVRLELIPYIEEFIINNELFENKNVIVSFFHTGVSSLVSILETEDKKYVLKIQLRDTGPRGEVLLSAIPIFSWSAFVFGSIRSDTTGSTNLIGSRIIGEFSSQNV